MLIIKFIQLPLRSTLFIIQDSKLPGNKPLNSLRVVAGVVRIHCVDTNAYGFINVIEQCNPGSTYIIRGTSVFIKANDLRSLFNA